MSRRRRRGALAALAAALALVTAAGHGPAPVGAAVDTPHQRTTPELALVERTPWVAAEGELRLALELRGIAPDATVRVTVHEPLRGRFELDASITRERLGRTLLTVVDSPVADAAPDGVLRLAVPVTEGTDGPPGSLRLLSEGISPVEVVVTDAEGDELVALVTHLVRLPTEVDAPLGVATALDLGAPPALQGDGSVVVPADVRARLTALADVLERHPDVVVTTMFTAETLSALAGGDAPLDAALVADLRTLTTAGVLAPVWSPWVRVDAARLDVSGLTSVVDEMLARGSATVRSTLGVAPDQATVLLPTEPTPAELAALTRHGVARVVLPASALPPIDPNTFVVALVSPFGLAAGDAVLTAITPDPALADRLDPSAGDPVLAAHHALTDLAALYFDRPAYARGTALVLPDPSSAPRLVSELLAGLASAPIITSASVADVMAAADLASAQGTDAPLTDPNDALVRAPLDGPDPTPLGDYARQRTLTTLAIDAAASVVPGSPRIDDLRELLAVTASADLDATGRDLYMLEITDQVDELTAGIGMEGGRTITLAARDGTLPLQLRNDTGGEVRVSLRFESDKLTFPEGERIDLTLVEESTPLEVPVEARASGTFPLDITLTSPDGVLELGRARYTVRSTAVSGLGLLLGGVAVAVLAVWWARTARRARRQRSHRHDSDIDPDSDGLADGRPDEAVVTER